MTGPAFDNIASVQPTHGPASAGKHPAEAVRHRLDIIAAGIGTVALVLTGIMAGEIGVTTHNQLVLNGSFIADAVGFLGVLGTAYYIVRDIRQKMNLPELTLGVSSCPASPATAVLSPALEVVKQQEQEMGLPPTPPAS